MTGFKGKVLMIIDNLVFFLFIALAFFLPISNAAVESFFGAIIFLFFIRILIDHPRLKTVKEFFLNRTNFVLLLFYLAIGLSIFVSGAFWKKSLNAWMFKWGEGVFLFYFVQLFLSRNKINVIIKTLIIATLLVSINGIYQYIHGEGFIRHFALTSARNLTAIRSTFPHYNNFGGFLASMFFIVAFAKLGRKDKGTYSLLAKILFLLLIIFNLFLTYSRGAWVALLLTLLIAGILSERKNARLVLTGFLLLFLISFLFIPSVRERVVITFQKGGFSTRFFIWKETLLMFKDSPLLGKGIGTFMDNASYYNLPLEYAHNCYLQILAETGLIGFLGFIFFLCSLLAPVYVKIKNIPSEDKGIYLGIIAFLISIFFDTHLYSLKLSIFFWLMAGVWTKSVKLTK